MRGEQEDQGLFENERQRNCPIRGGGGRENLKAGKGRKVSSLSLLANAAFSPAQAFVGRWKGPREKGGKSPLPSVFKVAKRPPKCPPPVLNGKGRGGQQQAAGPSGVNIGKATRGREELSPPSFLGRLSRKAKLLLKSP